VLKTSRIIKAGGAAADLFASSDTGAGAGAGTDAGAETGATDTVVKVYVNCVTHSHVPARVKESDPTIVNPLGNTACHLSSSSLPLFLGFCPLFVVHVPQITYTTHPLPLQAPSGS